MIDEARGDVDTCGGTAAAAAASTLAPEVMQFLETDVGGGVDLGPSLIAPAPQLEPNAAAECPEGGDYQRNELRLQPRADLIHDMTDPHWYSITFRADGDIPSCGSARWVLAQWKQPDGDSPFLAQRFDNGVLHVTVQNNDCRCVIAQAAGDPDAMAAAAAMTMATPSDLKRTKPIKCVVSNNAEGTPEELCEPQGLTVLTVGGLRPPDLPDPNEGWATMTYYVKGGGDGQVDIYAGANFVARVLGQIGYSTENPGKVKFKFGHYRDRIPGRASLSVDRLCFSRDARTCAPALQPVP